MQFGLPSRDVSGNWLDGRVTLTREAYTPYQRIGASIIVAQ
jgi:hypothetical protein